LILTASAATAAGLPGFTLAAQTAHFSFYSRGSKVEADKNERFLASVENTLGQPYSGRASYYRYETPEQVAVATGSFAQGGTFVRALLRTYGASKVADFFRACPKPGQRDAAFAQTFGVSLADATAQWMERL